MTQITPYFRYSIDARSSRRASWARAAAERWAKGRRLAARSTHETGGGAVAGAATSGFGDSGLAMIRPGSFRGEARIQATGRGKARSPPLSPLGNGGLSRVWAYTSGTEIYVAIEKNRGAVTNQTSAKMALIYEIVVAAVALLILALQIRELIHGRVADWSDYVLDVSLAILLISGYWGWKWGLSTLD